MCDVSEDKTRGHKLWQCGSVVEHRPRFGTRSGHIPAVAGSIPRRRHAGGS